MNRNDVNWRGYWTATPTPFTKAGELDEEALRGLIRYFVDEARVHGILLNGSTGEWFSQTLDERRRAAEIAVEEVKGVAPLVVSVTSPRADWAASLAKHAESAGADSVMASPPPSARPTDRELKAYYEEIFGAVSLPCWLYNFPQDNATNMSIPLVAELAKIPNVVAFKQSTSDYMEFIATIAAVGKELVILGDMLSRLGMALIAGGFGGDGHFGSGAIFGRLQPEFFERVWDGDYVRAGEIADFYAKVMAQLRGSSDGYNWKYGGMQPTLKAVMRLQGLSAGWSRKPKIDITDPKALEEIRTILDANGLLRRERALAAR